MSLLEKVKQNMENLGAANPAPSLTQTESLQKLRQAGTGRAGTEGSTPRRSNLQEVQTAEQGEEAFGQVQQSANLQSAQIGQAQDSIKQEENQSQRKWNEQQLNLREQLIRQTNDIITEYQQSGRQLDFQQEAARVEQLGVMMRLQDSKYTDKLKMEGKRARLDNALSFQDAMLRTVFEDEKGLLQSDLSFRRALKADQRDFTKYLSEIDLDFAMQMAKTDSSAANMQQMWTGIGNTTQAGIQAWQAYKTPPAKD